MLSRKIVGTGIGRAANGRLMTRISAPDTPHPTLKVWVASRPKYIPTRSADIGTILRTKMAT